MPRPRPDPHALRRVGRDPRATSSSGPRRRRCTGPTLVGNFKPVPSAYEDGLPQMQTQHTCILLEDLTDHCNLRCPTCFAESSPAASAIAPLAEVLASVDARLAQGERPHRRADAQRRRADALSVARAAARPPRRPADRAHPDQLERAAHRAGRRVRRDAQAPSRARRDLPAVRRRERRGIRVPPRCRHPPVQGARDRAAVGRRRLHDAHDDRGARRQRRRDRRGHPPRDGDARTSAASRSSRCSARDARRASTRTTGSPTPACSPGSRAQTDGEVTWRDLTALPCSHPHCCSVGYLLRDDSGEWKSLTALIGHDKLKEFLDLEPDLLANRIADSSINQALKDAVKGSLLDLLSEQSSLSHPSMSVDLARHLPELRPRDRHAHGARDLAAARASTSACARCWASACCASR